VNHDSVQVFLNLSSIIVKNLMFGFGDDRNPASDTVNVMEEILIEYICDVVRAPFLLSARSGDLCPSQCQIAGGSSRKARLSIEDLRRTLSRPPDAKKLARMEELLFMQEDIKRARAQIDDSEIIQSKSYLS
jgi:transcription initiation factor TFIID subunit 13